MTCQDVRDRLSAWRDGEAAGMAGLSTDERVAVGRHLDECVSCQEVLAGLDRSASSVRELPAPAAPRTVTQRALALGRQHARDMSAGQEVLATRISSVAARPAIQAARAAAPSLAPAPMALRSSKRRSPLRLALLVGLGLIALGLLAFALGLRF